MAQIQNTSLKLSTLLNMLPPLCQKSIVETKRKYCLEEKYINELRLRHKRMGSLVCGKQNYVFDYAMTDEDIKNTMRRLCEGSVYAFQKTIKEGYVPIEGGGRAGVVGYIANEDFDIAIECITSINIRIPHHVRGICARVYDLFCENNKGLIIYSPPSVGKTTLLRDLSIELSRGKYAKKVALIDTRHELDNGLIPRDCMIDTFAGYPKSMGIEIATRTMSSDVIICDEIGGDEITAIKKSLFCGVPVIAAAHAASLDDLRSREGINILIKEGAFSHAIGLSRKDRALEFCYEITAL